MPKYLFRGKYSQEGLTVIQEKGGSARRDVGKALFESFVGRLESFHFALGDDDLIAIVDLPDNGAAAALSTSVVASGRFTTFATVPLLTPEEIDVAMEAHEA